jgi:hypothetical protein
MFVSLESLADHSFQIPFLLSSLVWNPQHMIGGFTSDSYSYETSPFREHLWLI